MKKKQSNGLSTKSAALAAIGLALTLGSAALADETVTVSRARPEKTDGLYNAFEVAIGGGYLQGVGDVGRAAPSLTDSSGPGASLEVDLGWRMTPASLGR